MNQTLLSLSSSFFSHSKSEYLNRSKGSHLNFRIIRELLRSSHKERSPSPHARLLDSEDRQVGLEPELVVRVPLVGHPVGDRVDHVHFEEVRRHRVGVVQGLLLAA